MAAVNVAGTVAGTAAFAKDVSKPAPANKPAVIASLDRNCTLSPSLTHSGGETASCIGVGACLFVPALGHTATLRITVKAARPEARTNVSVDLSPAFAFSDGTATTPATTGSGTVARATIATLDLAAGETRTITRTVKAVRPGFGAIAVSARNRLTSARTDGGTDSVFATVGSSAATTFAGGGATVTAASMHSTVRSTRPSGGPERVSSRAMRTAPVSVDGVSRLYAIRPRTAGTSCVSGTWNFVDQNGVSRPAANTLVEALNSSNTLLSYAVSAATARIRSAGRPVAPARTST